MAYSVIETRVANPARKRNRVAKKKLRKKLSAKQIKFFGTPAQKAALKAKRRNAAKKSMRKKTHKPNPSKKRYAKTKGSKPSKKKYTKAKKRKNPTPEIISLMLGNPAHKKGKKKMASKKKHYKKTASKKNAGYQKTKKVTHHKKRHNPAGRLGRPMDWIKGGVGVIGGGVGTRLIPQFLGSTNTGAVGYGLNAITALALSWATHAFTKDAVLTASVAAGGFAALILRMVNDLTPYGSALSLSGFGDYMVSNWVTPQRIVDPRQAMFEVPNGWGQMPTLPAAAVMQNSGGDARTSGNAY